MNGYPLWLAHFTKADAPLIPSGWDTWRFWQYFNKGKLAGFDQKVDVDMNRFNGSLQDLMTFIDATVVVDD